MAGKYIEFVNPGYSTLYTRDLQYAASGASTRDNADPSNPFDSDSANPLLEGEWLEYTSAGKCSRQVADSSGAATAAAGKNIGQKPCGLHFSERGRYDAQITKKAHLVNGPQGFEFRTKLCAAASGTAAGDRVFVADLASPSASGKFVRGLHTEKTSANANGLDISDAGDLTAGDLVFCVGYVTRVHGTNDITVQYAPQFVVAPA